LTKAKHSSPVSVFTESKSESLTPFWDNQVLIKSKSSFSKYILNNI